MKHPRLVLLVVMVAVVGLSASGGRAEARATAAGASSIVAQVDSDGDGVPDSSDNCPAWFNPFQSLPAWSVPTDDPDCDGFATVDEDFIGTDPNLACGPNAWGPDHNSDGLISISDVLLMRASFGAKTPDDPIYDARRDLNPDGQISISDVLMMREFFDQECTTPLDTSLATDLASATEFLYTGSNPIQTGVAPGTIEPIRAAVLRGEVHDRDGNPLPEVTITVLDHLEFGQTLTRGDGMFDLAVNGGGLLTVTYSKEGFLPAQRQIDAPWQDYAFLPDVVLIPLDAAVTTVDLTSAEPFQVAQGSPVTDADGTRQATLLFPQGTIAEMVMPDGSTQPISTLNVRDTEYTVGENGPQAMPAELPPTSGYTYAVEFTVDQAMAAGATDVRFDQPLPFYVENFLDFPVGGIVPVGFYDRQQGQWIPSENGRIIQILSISGGLADLDVDGDGAADDAGALAALGITDAEREKLATLYAPGQSLWRVPITHFSPYDANWPFGLPEDAERQRKRPRSDEPENRPSKNSKSSIVERQNQVLGERIPLTGTSVTLNYRSGRVPGKVALRTLQIPLSEADVPASLEEIKLEIKVAGREFTQSFSPLPNQTHIFTWDGKDAYGRVLQGLQPVTVRIGYVYKGVYLAPAPLRASFARFSGSSGGSGRGGSVIVGSRAREELTIWTDWQDMIGSWDARGQGLGAWALSVHHVYDPMGRVLYRGDGRQRSASQLEKIIVTVAGTGEFGFGGDGGPATEAQFRTPIALAISPDGTLYVADNLNHRIRRVDPEGIITTVAGNGVSGFSGDGGVATDAQLDRPLGVAVHPDGSIYIADLGNDRIRRVDPAGIITTFAGNGVRGFGGDEGPATDAQLALPFDVAVHPDGSIYIADTGNKRIRRVSLDGIITTVAGDGVTCLFSFVTDPCGDGGPAIEAQLGNPGGLAVGLDGDLFIADSTSARIRRVGLDGIISTVAGGGFAVGDGGPATAARLSGPLDIAVGQDGFLYIGESQGSRVRRVDPEGIITTVAGTGERGFSGDRGPAKGAQLQVTRGLAVGPDGSLYVADVDNRRIRKIKTPLPGFSASDIAIVSEDGSELYQFDSSGRHLRTVHALTGAELHTFSYDSEGRLTTVTDGDGNVTTIERDANGNPTTIVAPFGQRTTLTSNADNYLASITNPAGQTHSFTYHGQGGLLATFTNPLGWVSRYTYDATGRLTAAEDPAGATTTWARTELADGFQVVETTPEGRATTFLVERPAGGVPRLVETAPSGAQAEVLIKGDGSTTTTFADGIVMTEVEGPDPRWGMQAPVMESVTIATPGGLTATRTLDRTVTLTDPADLFSLQTQTDTITFNGSIFTRVYDAASKTFTNTTATGRQRVITLDGQGRIVEIQLLGLAPIQLTYDAQGRMTTINQGSGVDARTGTITYNAGGFVGSATDPLLRTTEFDYDLAGRLVKTTLPGVREILATYDASGNLASIEPPGQPTHTITSTPVDLTEEYIPPDVGAGSNLTHYTHNLDRQLELVTRPDGQTVVINYDNAGRLSTITIPTGQASRAYDPVTGRVTSNTAPDGGIVTYGYDGSLLTEQTWSGTISGTVARTYDNEFRTATESVNGAQPLNFQYDQDDLLVQAGDLTLSRNAGNILIAGTALGNVTDTWTYNGFGELDGYSAANLGTDFYTVQQDRDKLGSITRTTETVGGVTTTFDYTYDLAGHLTEVQQNGSAVATYTYDSNGNRLSITDSNGTVNGTYDAQDRLTQYGAITYTYTANGELLSKTDSGGGGGGQTTTYDYDVLGNLLSVTLPDGTQIEYIVDGQDRRIGKRVNGTLVQGFLYRDQLNPIAELDGSNNVVSRFVYGPRAYVPDYMINGGATYRIISDHLGSPRLVVDVATGAIVQRMDYDVFGKVILDTNPGFQPFGFAGGLYDPETGLTRFGARDYDPETGRWTAKDPALFASGDTNLYRYAFNDPVNLIDPFGLRSVRDVQKIWDAWSWGQDKGKQVNKVIDGQREINQAANDPRKSEAEQLATKVDVYIDYLSMMPLPMDIVPFDPARKALKDGLENQKKHFDKINDAFDAWDRPFGGPPPRDC